MTWPMLEGFPHHARCRRPFVRADRSAVKYGSRCLLQGSELEALPEPQSLRPHKRHKFVPGQTRVAPAYRLAECVGRLEGGKVLGIGHAALTSLGAES